ncbi:MAG: extracellular solute-binding protein, partial [Chloroflexi bacterium]|nr:extracellular solute-binding protein [Chloroflexota bacterium]
MTFRGLTVLTLVLSACSTAAPSQPSGTTAPAATTVSKPAPSPAGSPPASPAASPGASPAAPPSPAAATTAPVAAAPLPTVAGSTEVSGELTYAWWGTSAFRNQVTQDVINLFQQKFPNVKIDPSISDFNTHFQKLTVAAAASDMPCLPQMQSTGLQAYATPNILRPLDDLVENKTIDLTNVPKGDVDTGRGFDGKLYMIPTGVFSRVDFYNDALLQQAGMQPPQETWTWDDYKTYMTQLQGKLPQGMNALENNGGDMNPLVTWMLSHGQPPFQQKALGFDKQTLMDWFQFWEDLRTAGVATSAQEVAERAANAPLELHPLANGTVVFGSYAPNQIAGVQGGLTKSGKAGTIQLIKEPNGPAGSGDAIGTNGLTIGANCDSVPAAAAFINFFTNDAEAAAAYKSDNGAVSSTPLLEAQVNDPTADPQLHKQLQFQEHLTTGGFVKDITYPAGYSALPPLLT